MDAKSLMIGDWVRMRLSFGTQWYIDKVGVINPENEMEYEPIPLTEGILKANGWRYDYIFKIWVYEDEDKMDFSVTIDEIRGMSVSRYKYYPVIFITYVHELQHALRLCGLNDMADNFKVN